MQVGTCLRRSYVFDLRVWFSSCKVLLLLGGWVSLGKARARSKALDLDKHSSGLLVAMAYVLQGERAPGEDSQGETGQRY